MQSEMVLAGVIVCQKDESAETRVVKLNKSAGRPASSKVVAFRCVHASL